jgi:selenocysteine-specific elongation factor
MIIGTAGHVDHGKTALVRALTGIDTDRLAEEKRRGITIDLGYAYAGDLGFVDVPGHERFVHTMLAGSSGIDAALLVVALPEGIRPQTREHLQILTLLGIPRAVVALTKADLAPGNIPRANADLDDLLAGTPFAGAPMIPVSAATGQGIEALRAALLACGTSERDTAGRPRLAIDRAFNLPGAGLIVTGTLVAGRIAEGDRLVLSPSGLDLRVRGLRAQNRAAPEAEAGSRVALNVSGPRLSKDAVTRGDWILHPDLHAPVTALDALVRLLPTAPRPLRQDAQVHLHLAAAHVMARAAPLDRDRIEPGEQAPVRLTLQTPIGALARDRLVLRDSSAAATIGGGIVLDPFPPNRGRRTPARLAQLTALDAPDAATALTGLLAVPPGWTDRAAFARAWNVPDPDFPGTVTAGPLLIGRPAWDRLRANLLSELARHHAAHPDLPGLQPDRLRAALADRPPPQGLAAVLALLLQEAALAQDGPWLRLPGHRPVLSPQDERLWSAAAPMLAGPARFSPPRVRDLAQALDTPEPAVRAAMKRLARTGRLTEIAPDHFFPQRTVAEMAHLAAETEARFGELTAAQFRDRLAIGRKVAIQVLEFFDKSGLTIRQGDTRRLRPDRLALFPRQ